MTIKLPDKVEYIINRLLENGYEAYAVGGCVRDAMLKREPEDWDITTSAMPWEVKELFRRTVDTGIKHGTVTVLLDEDAFEVTTYRIDGEYEDGRHPKQVEFTRNLIEDLKRRDFTINAMAYNYATGLVDEFDGLGDLKKGIIRCVGNPKDRFNEDALRMMRAVRFSAQLGFFIEENTLLAIKELSGNISKISAERIRVELTKTILSKNPSYLKYLYDTGITTHVLSFYDSLVHEGKIDLINDMLRYTTHDKELAYAVLLHPFGGDAAKRVLRDLRFDNRTVEHVKVLAEYFLQDVDTDEVSIRRLVSNMSKELFEKRIALKKIYAKTIKNEHLLEQLKLIDDRYQLIVNRGDCLSLKELKLAGADLIKLGYAPGKELGDILDMLLEKVLENPQLNDKEQLLNILK